MTKVVFAFGRFNPPTIGHQKLIDKVKSEASRKGATPRVYLSHSQDAKRNPLDYNTKFRFVKRAFGNLVTKSSSKNLVQILKELGDEGVTEVTIVVGSDRVKEFKKLLKTDFYFNKINVINAGERDPDASDVSGMSASKMREAAASGNYAIFKKGTPKMLSEKDKKDMYNEIRDVMGITEEKNKETDDMNMDSEPDDEELDKFMNTLNIDKLDEEEDSIFDEEYDGQQDLQERQPLTIAQRLKRARVMRRLAPRIKRKREMLKRRMADTTRLTRRARKAAIKFLRRRAAGRQGVRYASLGPSQKIAIDKLIMKRMPMVGRIASRILPRIRKAELERLKKVRAAKKEDVNNHFNNFIAEREFENLQKKAEKSGIPLDIIFECYIRESDSKKAFERVNSFVSGGKAREIDSDLVEKLNQIKEASSAMDRLKKFDKSREAAGKRPIFKKDFAKNFLTVKMKRPGMLSVMNVPAKEVDRYRKIGFEVVDDLGRTHHSASDKK